MPQLTLPELKPGRRVRPGDVERWAAQRGLRRLIGADEAGRGPLAGPVVAAAVALPPKHGIRGLDDSKLLEPEVRVRLAAKIRARALAFAVVELSADAIDRSDIGPPDLVVIDGCDAVPCRHVQRPVIGGDARSTHIAAASILAKVHRDAVMGTLAAAFPAYAFETNKGYCTDAHRAGILAVGPCILHRRSFRLL